MTDGNLKDIANFSFSNHQRCARRCSFHSRSAAVRRAIQFDVVPLEVVARQISPDVGGECWSQANVILPAGDVKIGNLDYDIYSNARFNQERKSVSRLEDERRESGKHDV